jgi:hypothetical protein
VEWPGWLPPEVVKTGAPWLLVFFLVVALFSGRLRTKRELDSLTAIWEERLREAKEYGSGLLQLVKGYQELDSKRDERMDELLEGNRVITQTLENLPELRPRRQGPARGGRES